MLKIDILEDSVKNLPTEMIDEFVPGSRFGSALANLGDLQNDGYEDFAVGMFLDQNLKFY